LLSYSSPLPIEKEYMFPKRRNPQPKYLEHFLVLIFFLLHSSIKEKMKKKKD